MPDPKFPVAPGFEGQARTLADAIAKALGGAFDRYRVANRSLATSQGRVGFDAYGRVNAFDPLARARGGSVAERLTRERIDERRDQEQARAERAADRAREKAEKDRERAEKSREREQERADRQRARTESALDRLMAKDRKDREREEARRDRLLGRQNAADARDVARSAREAARAETQAAKEAKQQERERVSAGQAAAQASYARTIQYLQLGGMGGAAGTYGRLKAASGLAGGSVAGRLLSRAALPLAVAGAGIEGGARIADVAWDPYTTNAEAGRALLKNFGLSKPVDWFDRFTGRKYAYEQADVAHRKRMLQLGANTEIRQIALQRDPMQAALASRADAYGRGSAVLEQVTDRSTAVGERDFREQSRLLAIRREGAKAEREAAAAVAERSRTVYQLGVLEKEGLELEKRRRALVREVDRGGSGADRQATLYRLTETETAIQQNAGLRQQARGSVAGAYQREAQARAESRMTEVREVRARAEFLEERAARGGSSAERLGRMNPFQRAWAAAAFESLKANGPDALPDSLKALADNFAPGDAAKIYESYGARTGEYQRGQRLGLADFPGGGSPEQLRRQAAEERNRAEGKEFGVQGELARATEAAGRDLGAYLGEAIQTLTNAAKREIDNKIRQQRGLQS